MEAVKGQRGYWHYTNGEWFSKDKLRTLCGRGVSPNNRRFNLDRVLVDCPKCIKFHQGKKTVITFYA